MKLSKNLLASLLITILSGCAAIPNSYRGVYSNTQAPWSIEVSGSSISVLNPDGTTADIETRKLNYTELASMTPGIYLAENPVNSSLLEVYWLTHDITVPEQTGRLTWYETNLRQSYFLGRADDAVVDDTIIENMEWIECRAGRVMLDTDNETWQIGCPAGVDVYQFKRVMP